VIIRESRNALFTRKGDDLETEVPVPMTTAALGGEIKVPTLRGSVTMKIPECSQSGQIFRLGSQGLSKMNGQGKGNLFAKIKIQMPKTLDEEQRNLLRKLAALEVSV
jgi:DnaJ-class molecular chaperone